MKRKLGQFFTKNDYWKVPQVLNFINSYDFQKVLDPFAGDGDLLKHFQNEYKTIGYDIDSKLDWKFNDSLKNIPWIKNTFIVTNPPYLSRVSSRRRGIDHDAFEIDKKWSDLYQIALEKILIAKMPGIAILPEIFTKSKFPKKHIYSITILIPNPFEDTQTPVCIVCFNGNKNWDKTLIFKNREKIGYLEDIQKLVTSSLKNANDVAVNFNVEKGKLALIAYDSIDSNKKIQFIEANKLIYNKPQKVSSRVVTKIKINQKITNEFIYELNKKLSLYRFQTKDILLAPFKGNTKQNQRRRRLDYKTARRIINSI